jgi:Methyltransferase domain
MGACCSTGLDEIFDDRIARSEARRFQRRGLPRRSRKLLDAVETAMEVPGSTCLEVGAGIGGLSLTLLQRGAAAASIVDAVPTYVETARRLAGELGVADRLSLELANYADGPHGGPVDLVIMDRVVCCHPDWRGLLEPASRQAGRAIALSYPRSVWWSRAAIAAVNIIQKLRRMVFRVYVHPPAAMHASLRERGFEPRVTGHHGPWEILVAVRRA